MAVLPAFLFANIGRRWKPSSTGNALVPDSLRIGRDNRFTPGAVPVRFTLRNPSAVSAALRVELAVGIPDGLDFQQVQAGTWSDAFEQRYVGTYEVPAGGLREVRVFAQVNWQDRLVAVRVRQADGEELDYQEVEGHTVWRGGEVMILGARPVVCESIKKLLLLSGNRQEQTLKSGRAHVECVEQPPAQASDYAPTQSVIVAGPLRMSASQLTALEGYLRTGGEGVFVGNAGREAAVFRTPLMHAMSKRPDPDAGPRATAPGEDFGYGTLYWVPQANQRLADLYNHNLFGEAVDVPGLKLVFPDTGGDQPSQLLQAQSPKFNFLPWHLVLLWLGGYTLAAGVVNFLLLRWLNRREWGWVTVPLLALVCSGGLYLNAVSQRSHSFRLDDVKMLWMDDRSSMALVREKARVSAPREEGIHVEAPPSMVWQGPTQALEHFAFDPSVDLFSGDRTNSRGHAWTVQVAPLQVFELPMLQWSYRDMYFQYLESLPGTVHMSRTGKLVNGSNISFEDAVLCANGKRYLLGAFAAGAEVDLDRVKSENRFEKEGTPPDSQPVLDQPNDITARTLSRLTMGVPRDDRSATHGAVFYGVSHAAWAGPKIREHKDQGSQLAVVIVSFQEGLNRP